MTRDDVDPRLRSRRLARAALALLWLFAALHAAAEGHVRSVEVKRAGDGYAVEAIMFAPVAPERAWDVLTDFDHMDRFVPNVKSSRVIARDGQRVTVEQQGVAHFGALNIPYTSQRQMELQPQSAIRSRQVSGNMKRVETVMKLSAEGAGTRLDYHLELVPSLLASGVLSEEFLRHEVDEQFNAIIGEMIRRKP
jgi:ribosome-associated toxin RatA of RatAB toxin-antitoxin module